MYDVKVLDLSAIVAETRLVEPGKRVVEIFVLDMPIGNQLKLRLGTNIAFITVSKPFSLEPTAEYDNNNGVFWRNDIPQAGVVVELIIVYGDKLAALV